MFSRHPWAGAAIWSSVVAVALICALVVIELAFQSSALAFSAERSQIRADYRDRKSVV